MKEYYKDKELFIAKAKEVHGDRFKRYAYHKVHLKNSYTPIKIVCKYHGEFTQQPSTHINGSGCPTCGRHKFIDTTEFIKRAINKHGDKFDYSKFSYVNNSTKSTIRCEEHGEFEQTPLAHLKGKGCPKCGVKNNLGKKPITTKEFIEKAKKKHGERYKYDKVVYRNSDTKIKITCLKHGDFLQSPSSHLRGSGCRQCYVDKRRKNHLLTERTCVDCGNNYPIEKFPHHSRICNNCKYDRVLAKKGKVRKGHKRKTMVCEEFIKKSKEVHGVYAKKYDYSKVKDIDRAIRKVTIKCKVHGEFTKRANEHLRGKGCPECAKQSYMDTDKFILKARDVHNRQYDYSKVKYVNKKTPVTIICPHHGEFVQGPFPHLRGDTCPDCSGIPTNKFGVTNTQDFITKAREVHGDKYGYEKIEFTNISAFMTIICPEHGEFTQGGGIHLNGSGCQMCAREKSAERIRKRTYASIKGGKQVFTSKIVIKQLYSGKVIVFKGLHDKEILKGSHPKVIKEAIERKDKIFIGEFDEEKMAYKVVNVEYEFHK